MSMSGSEGSAGFYDFNGLMRCAYQAYEINRKLFWSDTASYPLKALSLT